MSWLLKISLLASLASLAAALIAQYGFHLAPCELCLLQRVPYAVVIVVSAVALLVPLLQKWMTIIVIAAFLCGGVIASYHAMVEKHVIAGPDKCASSLSAGSAEDLLKKIQQAPAVACDQPQWEFHGITMALLNTVWSFLLAAFFITAFRRLNTR